MHPKDNGLEGKINSEHHVFKSNAERKIAGYLNENHIKYRYEAGVLINSHEGKIRIWYPDFYLPEFKAYIEYYGMMNQPGYNKGIQIKESVYEKNDMDVIAVYPWMFAEDWKGYIMDEIEKTMKKRYSLFKSKQAQYRGRQNFSGYKKTAPSYSKRNFIKKSY